MRCRHLLTLALLLAGCSGPSSVVDSGVVDAGFDAGLEGPACSSPKDCRALNFEGACRSGKCVAQVPCADDFECGLGESCVAGACLFTGCGADADCATGRCRTDVFACSECGANSDCPSVRPVCDPTTNKCVQCKTDSQCDQPGPAHCDAPSGACVHCLEDAHCPNGLFCSAAHVCTGAKEGAACPMGVTCDEGLLCVALGGVNTCLKGCQLDAPTCPTPQICFKLTFSGGSGLVFDQGGPLGVCYQPQQGLKGYRESCTRVASTESVSNCQPNLSCVPDSANVSLCRTFCDVNVSGGTACPTNERCHTFSGDYSGRLYGLCYPDNGWGDKCNKDSSCRTGQACTPYEDFAATGELSNLCQYAVGQAPGMAPCADTPQPDGGVLKADKVCASGSCQADPLISSGKYFCYSACATDGDCSVAGRTGYCEGQFGFPTATATGTLLGCRPGCTSTPGCAAYGAGVVCRGRFNGSYQASLHTTCGPAAGSLPPGASCFSSPQCRSGFCLFDDGRGVRRNGTCAEACDTAADCANDAGIPSNTGPLGCLPTVLMGFRGFDGVAGTQDDVLLGAKLCGGGSCTVDADCGSGAVCVPDADSTDAGHGLVLRCRPATVGVTPAGSTCFSDADCGSGVCGTLQPPSLGSGKACLGACTAATACPGVSTCRVGGLKVTTLGGPVSLDSCAP